jgi:hypothetical protein
MKAKNPLPGDANHSGENNMFVFRRGRDWCCMREDQHQFLSLVGQPPARLTVEQVAWLLNCQTHDVPILVSSRLLKPLGNPPQNGIKFFSTAEVAEMTKDRAWLAKMTNTISQHWHKRNVRQKNGALHGFAPALDFPVAAAR